MADDETAPPAAPPGLDAAPGRASPAPGGGGDTWRDVGGPDGEAGGRGRGRGGRGGSTARPGHAAPPTPAAAGQAGDATAPAPDLPPGLPAGGAGAAAAAAPPATTDDAAPPPPPPPRPPLAMARRWSAGRGGLGGAPPLSSVPVGTECTGVVAMVRDAFGFINSPAFEEQLFFHQSEVVAPDDEGEGGGGGGGGGGPPPPPPPPPQQQGRRRGAPPRPLPPPGTEVSFAVGPPGGKTNKPTALRVKPLPPGSLATHAVGDAVLRGVVERELRGGGRPDAYGGRIAVDAASSAAPADGPALAASYTFSAPDLVDGHPAARPRLGEAVSFSIATDAATGDAWATRVARVRERGVVAATRPTDRAGYGFIRCLDRPGQLFFHQSGVLGGCGPVPPGTEVLFSVVDAGAVGGPDARGGFGAFGGRERGGGRSGPVAVAVEPQPDGTFPPTMDVPGGRGLVGRVVRARAKGAGPAGAPALSFVDPAGGRAIVLLGEAGGEATHLVVPGGGGGGGGQAKGAADAAGSGGEGGDDDGGDGGDDGDGGDGGGGSARGSVGHASGSDEPAPAPAAAGPGDGPPHPAAAPAIAPPDLTGITDSSPAAHPLAVDDDVSFRLVTLTRTGARAAVDVALVARGADRRELGTVAALKKGFGLIKCVDRPGDALFRYENLDGCRVVDEEEEGGGGGGGGHSAAADAPTTLRKGDDVEFTAGRDVRGRFVALAVRRAPPGSAAVVTVDPAVRVGWVTARLAKKGKVTHSAGVLEYVLTAGDEAAVRAALGGGEDGPPALTLPPPGTRARLAFEAGDLGDPAANPRVGDAVIFRASTDARAVRAAVAAGAPPAVCVAAGRRAVRVSPITVTGARVALFKNGFGFLDWPGWVATIQAATAGEGSAVVDGSALLSAAAEPGAGAGEPDAGAGAGAGEPPAEDDGGEGEAAAAAPASAPAARPTDRLYFKASEVEGLPAGAAPLRRGDTVTFTLAERPATHEPVAHRVRRTAEVGGGGGGGGPGRGRLEFVAEKNPNAPKFTSNQAAGARGSMSARLARAPDGPGAKGFTAATSAPGRARVLEARAAAAAAAAAALNPAASEFVMPDAAAVGQ